MYANKGVRGAVSVFIVLILVPCIVASSLFIDVGRVSLGKGVATSAADLALNSLMSNYDEVLTDYYGFVASCQNIEDFYAETTEYFLAALQSQGLSDDEIDSVLAVYQKYIGDTDQVSDLMELSCVSDDMTKIVGEATDASVGGSSAIIKDQMVEFMKFRGPVNIVANIIDRLKKNKADGIADQADESKAVTDAKQEFASDEEALLKLAFDIYTAIKAYEDQKINITRLENLMNKMVEYRKLYLEMTEKIISNLHKTDKLKTFTRPTYRLSYAKKTYTASNVCSRKETIDGVTTYYVDGDKVKSVFKEVSDAITAFDNARANVVSKVGDTLINATIGTGDSNANAIQWWAQVSSKISEPLETFKTKAKNMLDAYNKMKVMYEDCTYDGSLPNYKSNETVDLLFASKYDSTYESLKDKVETRQSTYLTAGKVNNSNKYLKLVNKLETVSRNNSSLIVASNVKLSNGKTIGVTASEISSYLDTEATALENAIKALDDAIGDKWYKKGLDDLTDYVNNYNASFNTWSGAVNGLSADNPLADAEKEELSKYNQNTDNGENDDKERQIKIEEKDVTELETRLINIRSQLQTAYDKINELKYSGKKLLDLDNYDKVYNAIKGEIGDVPLTNGEIKSKAKTIFAEEFTPYSANLNSAILTLPNIKADDYNPNLTQKKPKLYDWMGRKFKGTTDKQYNENKAEVDSVKGGATEKEASAKETTKTDGISKTDITSLTAASDFPSGLDGENSCGLISGIGDLASIIGHLVKGEFTAIRDALYATEYVMSMFSYATFNEEGKYHLAKDTVQGFNYKTKDTAYAQVADAWKNDELFFTDNKTLTNKMINAENNVAFGSEAEYVLYGGKNQDNVNSAFGSIYAIRYALNTTSGFQHFWSGESLTALAIEGFADIIFVATSGVIPKSVVKVAAILLLTAIESGVDLQRMRDGFPVEFYKTKDNQWKTSFERGNNDGGTNGDFVETETGLFYSDYIYLFLCMGFNGKNASEMYYRVGDLIQANMRKTQGDKYTLNKSRVYFKLNAKVRVDPLMLEIPMVSSYTEGIGATESIAQDDWCTFEINVVRGYS